MLTTIKAKVEIDEEILNQVFPGAQPTDVLGRAKNTRAKNRN